MKENQKKLYRCNECGLHYRSETIAIKCEKWCKENKSCNLEIIKYSIESRQSREEVNSLDHHQKERP